MTLTVTLAQDKTALREEFALFRRELHAAKSEEEVKAAITKYTGSTKVTIVGIDRVSYTKVLIPEIRFPGPRITDAEGNGGFAPSGSLNGNLRLGKGMVGYQFDSMQILLVINLSDHEITLPVTEDEQSVVITPDATPVYVIVARTTDVSDPMTDGGPKKEDRIRGIFRIKKGNPPNFLRRE